MTLAPRILGLDPGLQLTGYAILKGDDTPQVVEAGVLRSTEGRTSAELPPRLVALYNGTVELIEQFQPGVVVVEQLYAHYLHPRTAILMAHARGVLLLAAGRADLPVVHYAATHVKRAITGNGRAPKDQVQRAVMHQLGLLTIPEPPDVADALAIALCHFHSQRVQVRPG